MRAKVKILLYTVAIMLPMQALGLDDPLHPTFPTIPEDYKELDSNSLINDARVTFGFEPVVEKTDGYKVTSPQGETFYVDNVEQPSCVFYATYVNNDGQDPGFTSGLEVFSNVYIEGTSINYVQ